MPSFPNLRPSHVWTWLAQVPNVTNPKYKGAKLSFVTSLVCLPSFKREHSNIQASFLKAMTSHIWAWFLQVPNVTHQVTTKQAQ
ncbi:hypothetical protein PIB30_102588, partial [Stylosanthes scabra]|nr:hypothetical protein [Stylosanthes scabra]